MGAAYKFVEIENLLIRNIDIWYHNKCMPSLIS